jgi:hypothetical protein
MTIPASSIHFNDDGTAWVIPQDDFMAGGFRNYDRPCDFCYGRGTDKVCDGTGRHTFTVEVEAGPLFDHGGWGGTRTFTVSVVPGVVLPIYAAPARPDHRAIIQLQAPHSGAVLFDPVLPTAPIITLPSAAKPDMRVVKLQVHG